MDCGPSPGFVVGDPSTVFQLALIDEAVFGAASLGLVAATQRRWRGRRV